MFIQTEQTPNPDTVKFLPGCEVTGRDGSYDFRDADKAEKDSPLAARLFKIRGIAGVFLGSDFISVTKIPENDWFDLKATVLAAILDHFTHGFPVLTLENSDNGQKSDENDPEIVKQIKILIDTRVRPAVAQDGGDIVFDSFEDGIVYLHMRGACAGCPSSTATLKSGIENMLRHYIPEVLEVRAV